MKYLDEEIIKKREELKKAKYNNLETGYYVGGRIINFSREELFDLFSIYLPESMGIMPPELARIKYTSEFRPKVIMTTLDLSVNLGFSLFNKQFQIKETKKLVERVNSAIKRDHPNFRFYEKVKMKEIDGYRIAFRSHAMDSDLYNMMLAVQIEKQMVLCNFNCLYRDYEQWKDVIILIWESITKLEPKEGY